MPANLTPPYKAAEQRYREATDDAARLEALNEMMQLIPKHKGTEKLQAEIKAKIAKLKKAPAAKPGGRQSQITGQYPARGGRADSARWAA